MRVKMLSLALLALTSNCYCQVPVGQKSSDQRDRANDVATGMVADDKGNVYVTGYSKGSNSGYDYLTIKYDQNGKLLWSRRLDGGSKGDDKPAAIALDADGSAIVTGSSQGGTSDSDYLTVKYDSGGKELWIKRFNGAGNGFDSATALTVDSKGDAIITGFAKSKSSGYDCVTIKYDPVGREIWSKVYNGPDNEDDFGSAITCNELGDTFVAGYSKTSKTGSSYLLIKYSLDGSESWVRRYHLRKSQISQATSVVANKDGGATVTGFAQGSRANVDYVTLSYSSDGERLWEQRADGSGSGDDKPSSLVRDQAGNTYVTGGSEGDPGSGKDFLTIKYSPAGKVLWQKRYNGEGSGDDVATAIAVNPAGGIMVTGYSQGGETGSDFLTLAYDELGNPLWHNRYNGQANDVDRPVSVAFVAGVGTFVSGYSWGGTESGFDFVTVAYDLKGNQKWVQRFDGKGEASKNGAIEAMNFKARGNHV